MLDLLPGTHELIVDLLAVCLFVDLVCLLDGNEQLGEVDQDGEFLVGSLETGGNCDKVLDLLLDLFLMGRDYVLDLEEAGRQALLSEKEGRTVDVFLLYAESEQQALLNFIGEDLDDEAYEVNRHDSKEILA